ncbi:MAG: diguanylate cyclase [Planctomycetes bacterium]|nr:diguanylate cyclase [Planctomycetota bacterium]
MTPGERERLETLHRLNILDRIPEPAFERIVRLAKRLFGTPKAAITLVDEHRQWLLAREGIAAGESPRKGSFCERAIESDLPLVVLDARLDPRFSPPPDVRFYAGAPLVYASGIRIGALCVMDSSPRDFTPADAEALASLAAIVVDELKLRKVTRSLADQKEALTGILGSAGEGIVVADHTGRLTVFNARAEELLGVRAGEMSPERWSEAYVSFTPDGETPLPAEDLPMARALRGEATDRMEALIRNRHTGREVLISAIGRPLRDSKGRLRGGVVTFNEIAATRAETQRLAQLATTDALTGLPNRWALRERLDRQSGTCAVLMIDLDHFKRINDEHGHLEGDRVLAAVGAALRAAVRNSDFVARYGGEEFCVLLEEVGAGQAVEIAEKLRSTLRDLPGPPPVTGSIGVASSQACAVSSGDRLLAAADRALYRAKRGGRDRVEAATAGDVPAAT